MSQFMDRQCTVKWQINMHALLGAAAPYVGNWVSTHLQQQQQQQLVLL
jgi:hypothetical protein